jgi:hypothetical protein
MISSLSRSKNPFIENENITQITIQNALITAWEGDLFGLMSSSGIDG